MNTNRFIQGTVFLPDGRPAAGVEVALCTIQCGVMLTGTTFQKRLFGGDTHHERLEDYRHKTDHAGAFSFEPKPGAHTVVAVSPAGLGKVRCLDVKDSLQLRLEPWGKIQGIVRTRDRRWTDRKIVWNPMGQLTSWMTLFYENGMITARSDAGGNFTLENVPPGGGSVVIEEETSKTKICLTHVWVPAGQTIRVQVGGTGVTVTGKLTAPSGVEIRNWINQVKLPQIDSEWDSLPQPKGLTSEANERWRLEYSETEAGQAWLRQRRTYDLQTQADGTFVVPEVLPGTYWLHLHVMEGALGSGSPSTPGNSTRLIASFTRHNIVVPAPTADTPPLLDLGELVLTATH